MTGPAATRATAAVFSFGSTRSATWSVPGTTPLVTTFTPVLCTVQPVPTAAPYTVHDGRLLPPVPHGGAPGRLPRREGRRRAQDRRRKTRPATR